MSLPSSSKPLNYRLHEEMILWKIKIITMKILSCRIPALLQGVGYNTMFKDKEGKFRIVYHVHIAKIMLLQSW